MPLPKIEFTKPQIDSVKIDLSSAKVNFKRTIVKPGQVMPDFDSLFEGEDESPLDGIDYTGDPEIDTAEEQSEALKAVIAHRKSMLENWRVTVDPEFWFAVCFQSRAQKEEFLEKANLSDLGDKYLNGLELAEKLGVDITPIPLQQRPPSRPPTGLRSSDKILRYNPDKEGGDS